MDWLLDSLSYFEPIFNFLACLAAWLALPIWAAWKWIQGRIGSGKSFNLITLVNVASIFLFITAIAWLYSSFFNQSNHQTTTLATSETSDVTPLPTDTHTATPLPTNLPPPPDRVRAESYYMQGITHYNQYDYNGAIDHFTVAIEINPNYAEAHTQLGNSYSALGDTVRDGGHGNYEYLYEKAMESYNRAIAINPDLADAYYGRGDLYNERGEYEEALQDLNRGISIDDSDAMAHNDRGRSYIHLNEDELAERDFNRAIELGYSIAATTAAYYNRGFLYKRQGRAEAAIADFERFLELNDNSYWRERAEQQLAELRNQ
ncbi:MAG: tetratricopeptide repeat protein [Chloroflexaceae bacterium]|nr:tetratricopeptide repeat protein [Chloroflexaceae bacterium]